MNEEMPSQFDVWVNRENKDFKLYIYSIHKNVEESVSGLYFDPYSQEFRTLHLSFKFLKDNYKFGYRAGDIFVDIFHRQRKGESNGY